MCEPTNEPRFKPGDTAERELDNGAWVQVTIRSHALRWVGVHKDVAYVYQVQFDDTSRSQHPFLASEARLRPAERWEPCPHGEHRHCVTHGIWEAGVMERRVLPA